MDILNSTINDSYSTPGSEGENGFAVLPLRRGEKYVESLRFGSALYFILRGEVEFSCNEHLKRHFKSGDLLFIPQSSSVYGRSVTDSEIMVMPFDLLCVERACHDCSLSRSIDPGEYNIKNDFRPLKLNSTLQEFVALMRHYIRHNIGYGFLYQLKQRELLVILRESYTKKELAQLFYPVLGKDIGFKSRMLEVCHENLSVKELAEKFNMSPRNFSRRFREEFGESAHQWMLKEKAKRIQLRFAMPGVTISDVINEFGFTSPSYFWEYCRKQFGCTPQELMRKLRT